MSTSKSFDHNALQRKIFSRWVCSRLLLGDLHIPNFDCVNDLDGWTLAKLAEILSGEKCPNFKKIKRKTKLRAQQFDAADIALNFVFSLDVEMGVPPSSENIVDHDVKSMLALCWGLIRKFIRFSEEGGPSPQESLLMWVNMKIGGYDNIKTAKRIPHDFYDGTILCAIIHKHRPRLIDISNISPKNAHENLQKAFTAAKKCFDIDDFISPEEFLRLDDKSMFIYISEYYNGAARMRKIELAARRISRLIEYTKVNDEQKTKYNEKAKGLKKYFEKVMLMLNDREVDNTLQGAKDKLKKFQTYKNEDKQHILSKSLDIESQYNYIAVRLSDYHRPTYIPPKGLGLKGLNESLKKLESTEKDRSDALNKEYNRQIRLRQTYDKTKKIYDLFISWYNDSRIYLKERENVNSTSSATYHITKMKAYKKSKESFLGEIMDSINDNKEYLKSEKFEMIDEIEKIVIDIENKCVDLEEEYQLKDLIMQDHLKRENFNELLWIKDKNHKDIYNSIIKFLENESLYYMKKEKADSIGEASKCLSILDSNFEKLNSHKEMNMKQIIELGNIIKESKYETEYSSSIFLHTDKLEKREKDISLKYDEVNKLYEEKLVILKDDLKREEFKENVMLLNSQHKEIYEDFMDWAEKTKKDLDEKEVVDSISLARYQLNRSKVYIRKRKEQIDSNEKLKSIGNKIKSSCYDELSNWKFETPNEIDEREARIDEYLEELTVSYNNKKMILEDDLQREIFKENTLLLNSRHESSYKTLISWCEQIDEYFNKSEEVNSIADANLQIAILATNHSKCENESNYSLSSLKKLGQKIISAKYENLSTYTFDRPNIITDRETKIKEKIKELNKSHDLKKEKLIELLEHEKKKEANRISFSNKVSAIERWSSMAKQKCKQTHFGFNFTEVKNYINVIEREESEIKQNGEKLKGELIQIHEEGVTLNVKENAYTDESVSSVKKFYEDVEIDISHKNDIYKERLKIEEQNDRLCKNFADKIENFAEHLSSIRSKIAISDKSLEDQLETVKKMHQDDHEKGKLIPIKTLDEQIKSRNIVNNEHTFLKYDDACAIYEQFKTFLIRKANMLEETIERKKMKGVTLNQINEIKNQFEIFDEDKNGILSLSEIKRCLFSLGEEKNMNEVKKIIEKYGNSDENTMILDQFIKFNVDLLGVSDTKEEINQGFLIINKGLEYAIDENMDLISEDDLKFIKKTAERVNGKDDCWDYKLWIEEVFSR